MKELAYSLRSEKEIHREGYPTAKTERQARKAAKDENQKPARGNVEYNANTQNIPFLQYIAG